MTELAVLNPEIEGLLREIAADPTSTLLRLPPSGLRRSRRLGELPDRAGTTGLNLAERELLRRWREEVAYLLLVACFRTLVSTSRYAHRISTIGDAHKMNPEGGELRTRVAENCAEAVLCPNLRDGVDLLQQLSNCETRHSPSVFNLASAAARLAPVEMASCYAALHLILESNATAGIRMMSNRSFNSLVARRMAAVNTAYGHERLGALRAALDSVNGGDWPAGSEAVRSVSGLVLSAQVGDAVSLRRWVDSLSSLAPSVTTIKKIIKKIEGRRRAGEWRPTDGATGRLRAFLSGSRPDWMEMANAFA
jgi:hypothetical protein